MPYCPECRYEYREGVKRCPDCDMALVAELPKQSPSADPDLYRDWVPIVHFTSQIYADMIREAFEKKQIPAVIYSSAGYFGLTGQMGVSSFRPIGGGYALLVPKEFIALANTEGEAILGEVWKRARAPEDRR